MNAHADVPLPVMSHGGMFTILHVIPKDPKQKWQHPSQRIKTAQSSPINKTDNCKVSK
jgi:hypothetical protein